eukprot:Pompholyxophrys_punicea_v1_NODE_260_length_2503_cov_15.998366.p4 type:complete len:130 gc:universal NODE_260_length_2503_cov_15.998366:641-1030(+)
MNTCEDGSAVDICFSMTAHRIHRICFSCGSLFDCNLVRRWRQTFRVFFFWKKVSHENFARMGNIRPICKILPSACQRPSTRLIVSTMSDTLYELCLLLSDNRMSLDLWETSSPSGKSIKYQTSFAMFRR